jgi:general secretion pathway protein M
MISKLLNNQTSIRTLIASHATLAASAYLAIIIGCGVGALVAVVDIIGSYSARNTSLEALAAFQGAGKDPAIQRERVQPKSLFLEGPTATLAGAALLQRLGTVITKVGGRVASTEIEQQSSSDGFLKATAIFEIDQPAVQQLLYEVESETPFLFIDHMTIQPAVAESEGGLLKVSLGVSAMWLAAK